MPNKSPLVVNDFDKIKQVKDESLVFLKENPVIQNKIANYLWAYHEIMYDLVPQNYLKWKSGYYFPCFESYFELENSYELCLEGFYKYSFFALRSVLELGFLRIFFSENFQEEKNFNKWFSSDDKTPRFQDSFKEIKKIKNYDLFDDRFKLSNRILKTNEELNNYIHTRGYHYSSFSQSKSNINKFSESSLIEYTNVMFSITSEIIIVMLIKYPIGLHALPLSRKFGLDLPFGGFLEEHQVDLIKSVLDLEEVHFLEDLSNQDLYVKMIKEKFDKIPDLPNEIMDEQIKEFIQKHPEWERLINHYFK